MNVNGIDVELNKISYNKSTVAEDGITYNIDTSKSYTAYQFSTVKNYFSEDRKEVLDEVINDMEFLLKQLKQTRDKSNNKELTI